MRLLNKKTLELHFFLEEHVPPYIILSHRWTGAETSMQEFTAQKHLSKDHWSPGTAKVLAFCEHVKSHEAEYVWVDTCCIDKSSSAELQEAINSMFKWYEQAELCVVYISDVELDARQSGDGEDEVRSKLRQSNWFSRGWTLQELLAPRKHTFVDCNWRSLGSRDELSDILHEITRIKPDYYGNTANIHSATVAERMSWLSLRKTSRIEDMAYCMLGIFDVNMTMLYGEGSKAFSRLQKEIIQIIEDESIFVWQPTEGMAEEDAPIPVLAPSPACFSVCRNVAVSKSTYLHRDPYRWTMKGLEFELYGQRVQQFSANELLVVLNCTVDGKRVAFNIRKTSLKSDQGSNVYQRLATTELLTLPEPSYSYPPNAEDKFRLQVHQLTLRQMNVQHGMLPGHRNVIYEFESENILFKVFIQ